MNATEEMKDLVELAIEEYGLDNIEDGVAQFGFTTQEDGDMIIVYGEVFGENVSIKLLSHKN